MHTIMTAPIFDFDVNKNHSDGSVTEAYVGFDSYMEGVLSRIGAKKIQT